MKIKSLLSSLTAISLMLVMGVSSKAHADTGLQFPGLPNCKPTDVSAVASIYKSVGGSLELSFLPFEFNPTHPFDNATNFVKLVLPGGHVQLRMTVMLAYRSDHKLILPSDYSQRVKATDAWTKSMRTYAASLGLGSSFAVTIVPFLEERYSTLTQDTAMLNLIAAIQATDGISTPFRRSPINEAARYRVGTIAHEYHGPTPRGLPLVRYDRWSNDGAELSESTYMTSHRAALAIGVTPLYWTAGLNGRDIYSESTPPSDRKNLAPFRGSATSTLGLLVKRVLSSR